MEEELLEPQTPAQWQEAVNAAQFLLSLRACRRFGLIDEGGPSPNVERCDAILWQGRRLGYRPEPFEQLCWGFPAMREAARTRK